MKVVERNYPKSYVGKAISKVGDTLLLLNETGQRVCKRGVLRIERENEI